MSILQYKPMGILIISKIGSKFKNILSKSTTTNMQHFYCLIWLPWSPLRWNGKMFAALAALGLVFGFQVENCIKYNNLLFNLLFLFMDGISRSKSISRYDKIHGFIK